MPPGVITSLLPDGTTNPSALNIEIDLPVYPGSVGDVAGYVRIWGLALKELSQAFNLNQQPDGSYRRIKIFGGMAKGYPLADPSQRGLLVDGSILQAFGNWIGTDMTLDMFVGPPTGTQTTPKNYTFTWAKNEKLSVMIARVLKTVAPNLKQQITINDSRVANEDKVGYYETFTQFAQAVQGMTYGLLGNADLGVIMITDGQTVSVTEGTPISPISGSTVKDIRFRDLLGQVTWCRPFEITAKMVMRGDLHPFDYVRFPANLNVTNTVQAMSGQGGTGPQHPSNTLGFHGQFLITQMQHWGNFRQPDAMSWNTTIWATPQVNSEGTATTSTQSTANTTGGAGP